MNYLSTLSVDAAEQIKRLEDTTDWKIKEQVVVYLNNAIEEVENINLQNFNINRLIIRYKL